jgi:cysteinyl-tRNA synthetase
MLDSKNLKKESGESRARVASDSEKKNPRDFVLWFSVQGSKFKGHLLKWDFIDERMLDYAELNNLKEIAGKDSGVEILDILDEKKPSAKKIKYKITGWPGWHIECSAMSMKYLGERFDIHCGGIDHIPVHHTNEIAQSEGATGKKWVNYWLHGNFLVMGREKMAKSKGNFITLQTLIEKGYSPLIYRYFCLTTHYRNELLFSWQSLDASKNAFNTLKNKILEIKQNLERREMCSTPILKYKKEFLKIINDDLNMPQALALFWQVLRNEKLSNNEKYALVLDFDKVFGLGLDEIRQEKTEISKEIESLLNEREEARKNKQWEKSDELRNKIRELGYIVEDTDEGQKIRKI